MATTSVDLSPVPLDLLKVRAGDRNAVELTFTQDGAPLDLTGAVLTAQGRTTVTDETAALDAVITVNDAPAGKATLTWPGDAVRSALAGKATWSGVWDLQMAAGTGDPITLVAGKLTLELDVTRTTPTG